MVFNGCKNNIIFSLRPLLLYLSSLVWPMKTVLKDFFSYKGLPRLSLVLILLTSLYTLWYFHPWKKNDDGNRGVIKWDVITYYSYLPATVIHGDVSLEFLDEGKINNDNKFWPVEIENGNKLIVTSMGLSFMYAPFFFMAHVLAPLAGQANDGFSNIYQLFLIISGLFYSFMGLILLSRFLRKHFDPVVTALTILAIGLGTNLYFYSTIEAAMPHGHNFFLITVFLLGVIQWYKRPTWYLALAMGLLFGFIVLVRPTNILLFFFLFLYGVSSWKSLQKRVLFYLSKWYLVLLMIGAFLLPWIPQFLYWKLITGHYVYFSYADKGASFFFAHPRILDSLFHIRKGWLIYTPIMVFALAGIPLLYREQRTWFVALAVYVPLMIYVQSSWWCWWFGGGWGLRPYISMYPLLAFPMATLLKKLSSLRVRYYYHGLITAMLLLVAYQIFQTRQFTTNAIHYSGTTLKSYAENFLRTYPTGPSWKMLDLPDFQLARMGIYVSYPTSEDKEAWKAMDKADALESIREELNRDRALVRQIKRYAKREEITIDSAMQEVMDRIYSERTN